MFRTHQLNWLAEWMSDQPLKVQESLVSALERQFPSFDRARFLEHSKAYQERWTQTIAQAGGQKDERQRLAEAARRAFGTLTPKERLAIIVTDKDRWR